MAQRGFCNACQDVCWCEEVGGTSIHVVIPVPEILGLHTLVRSMFLPLHSFLFICSFCSLHACRHSHHQGPTGAPTTCLSPHQPPRCVTATPRCCWPRSLILTKQAVRRAPVPTRASLAAITIADRTGPAVECLARKMRTIEGVPAVPPALRPTNLIAAHPASPTRTTWPGLEVPGHSAPP